MPGFPFLAHTPKQVILAKHCQYCCRREQNWLGTQGKDYMHDAASFACSRAHADANTLTTYSLDPFCRSCTMTCLVPLKTGYSVPQPSEVESNVALTWQPTVFTKCDASTDQFRAVHCSRLLAILSNTDLARLGTKRNRVVAHLWSQHSSREPRTGDSSVPPDLASPASKAFSAGMAAANQHWDVLALWHCSILLQSRAALTDRPDSPD